MTNATSLLTGEPSSWYNASLLSATQITSEGLKLLCDESARMKELVATKGGDDRLAHRILCTLFYEVSTRTSCSFQAAMLRLGGSCIHVDANSASSTQKGESLSDTLTCLGGYTDVIVLRTSSTTTSAGANWKVKDSSSSSSSSSSSGGNKPLINAGDGIGEHPTQALLDFFTMRDELGEHRLMIDSNDNSQHMMPVTTKKPLTIVMLGDLKNGRTVHSLAKLLVRSGTQRTMRLVYCSPPSLQMPQSVKDYVSSAAASVGGIDHVEQIECTDIQDVITTLSPDVLYVTRIQRERFQNNMEEYEQVKGSYVITKEFMSKAPSDMIVLHPLPRVDEIHPEVDDDPRAAYFRQAENGMYVRMALLALVLGKA
jgi:aspartate carbamoyltransferase